MWCKAWENSCYDQAYHSDTEWSCLVNCFLNTWNKFHWMVFCYLFQILSLQPVFKVYVILASNKKCLFQNRHKPVIFAMIYRCHCLTWAVFCFVSKNASSVLGGRKAPLCELVEWAPVLYVLPHSSKQKKSQKKLKSWPWISDSLEVTPAYKWNIKP